METVHAALRRAIPQLTHAGVDTPRLDAEVLLGEVTGHDRGWLWAHPEHRLSAEEVARFSVLLTRRAWREPLAYLLGEREFYGRPFFVTPDVLVPRPETELLVEAVLAWARQHAVRRIADIGAGSGAIAVTLAAEMSELEILAVELSPAALAVARRNAERHGVAERITFLTGDLLAPLRAGGYPPLPVIVANLPYIADEEFSELMPEVRVYEPSLALRAGRDGLAYIRRLIVESPALLLPGGLLALEIGAGQVGHVTGLLRAPTWYTTSIISDYGGIQRHVLAEVSPKS